MKKFAFMFVALLLAQNALAGGTQCSVVKKEAVTLKSILDPEAGGACCSWGPIQNCFPGC